MNKDEEDFRKLWLAEREAYKALGEYLRQKITATLTEDLGEIGFLELVKIPISYRVKTDASLLEKAFSRRGKNYQSPYDEIEDKVGLRIVVLMGSQLKVVTDVLKALNGIDATIARDFAEERKKQPLMFDYQSIHYILRPSAKMELGASIVDQTFACEVQVRTILQHAYAELTHDTLYKPNVAADPAVHRSAALSQALMEAADNYFEEVHSKIQSAKAPYDRLKVLLSNLYDELVQMPVQHSPLNATTIDFLKELVPSEDVSQIKEFYEQKKWIMDKIRNRHSDYWIFRMPSILLIYWAASNNPRKVVDQDFLSRDDLEIVFSDLGQGYPE